MTRVKQNRMAVFVIALLAGIAAAFIGMLMTQSPLCAAIFGGCISFAAAVLGGRTEREYRASLTDRAEKTEQDTDAAITWEVRMNDVIAGQISDRELADIQSNVAGDWRVWFSQLVNVLGVPVAIIDKLLVAVPAIAFWVILAFALTDPTTLIQTLTAIRNASPAGIQHAVASALTTLSVLGFMLYMFTWLLQGYTFGLRNVASDEFGQRLRRRLKISATGELQIARIADGRRSQYSPDLFGWMRSRAESRRAARKASAGER